MIRRKSERWYVVHTYSGYENKVKNNLEHRIGSMHMNDKIFEVVVPVEDVLEYKSGRKQLIQKKLLPGYLLVRMKLDDDSWYVVRNTPGVTGFVGTSARPTPISNDEVDRILARQKACLLYTSDAADDLLCVDLGGRRIIKKKKKKK